MSTEPVVVELDRDVYEALQRMAKPFVDTPSSVIKKLIQQVSSAAGEPSPVELLATCEKVKSFRGASIPFGPLRATYKPRGGKKAFQFEAQVTSEGIELEGKVFDNPSSAGIHAKTLAGAKGSAASTNGWEFWEYYDSESGSWILIDKLRQKKN